MLALQPCLGDSASSGLLSSGPHDFPADAHKDLPLGGDVGIQNSSHLQLHPSAPQLHCVPPLMGADESSRPSLVYYTSQQHDSPSHGACDSPYMASHMPHSMATHHSPSHMAHGSPVQWQHSSPVPMPCNSPSNSLHLAHGSPGHGSCNSPVHMACNSGLHMPHNSPAHISQGSPSPQSSDYVGAVSERCKFCGLELPMDTQAVVAHFNSHWQQCEAPYTAPYKFPGTRYMAGESYAGYELQREGGLVADHSTGAMGSADSRFSPLNLTGRPRVCPSPLQQTCPPDSPMYAPPSNAAPYQGVYAAPTPFFGASCTYNTAGPLPPQPLLLPKAPQPFTHNLDSVGLAIPVLTPHPPPGESCPPDGLPHPADPADQVSHPADQDPHPADSVVCPPTDPMGGGHGADHMVCPNGPCSGGQQLSVALQTFVSQQLSVEPHGALSVGTPPSVLVTAPSFAFVNQGPSAVNTPSCASGNSPSGVTVNSPSCISVNSSSPVLVNSPPGVPAHLPGAAAPPPPGAPPHPPGAAVNPPLGVQPHPPGAAAVQSPGAGARAPWGGPYKCSVCNAEFEAKEALQAHCQAHEAAKPYRCDACGLGLCNKKALKRHKLTHTGLKPYKCATCARSFLQKHDLQRHAAVHARPKVLTCTRCERTFTAPAPLKLHRCRPARRPSDFLCHICGDACANRASWSYHMWRHTKNPMFVPFQEVLSPVQS